MSLSEFAVKDAVLSVTAPSSAFASPCGNLLSPVPLKGDGEQNHHNTSENNGNTSAVLLNTAVVQRMSCPTPYAAHLATAALRTAKIYYQLFFEMVRRRRHQPDPRRKEAERNEEETPGGGGGPESNAESFRPALAVRLPRVSPPGLIATPAEQANASDKNNKSKNHAQRNPNARHPVGAPPQDSFNTNEDSKQPSPPSTAVRTLEMSPSSSCRFPNLSNRRPVASLEAAGEMPAVFTPPTADLPASGSRDGADDCVSFFSSSGSSLDSFTAAVGSPARVSSPVPRHTFYHTFFPPRLTRRERATVLRRILGHPPRPFDQLQWRELHAPGATATATTTTISSAAQANPTLSLDVNLTSLPNPPNPALIRLNVEQAAIDHFNPTNSTSNAPHSAQAKLNNLNCLNKTLTNSHSNLRLPVLLEAPLGSPLTTDPAEGWGERDSRTVSSPFSTGALHWAAERGYSFQPPPPQPVAKALEKTSLKTPHSETSARVAVTSFAASSAPPGVGVLPGGSIYTIPASQQGPEYFSQTQESGGKTLVVVMVGLPARGKTFLAQKICRLLGWQGTKAKVLNLQVAWFHALTRWHARPAEGEGGRTNDPPKSAAPPSTTTPTPPLPSPPTAPESRFFLRAEHFRRLLREPDSVERALYRYVLNCCAEDCRGFFAAGGQVLLLNDDFVTDEIRREVEAVFRAVGQQFLYMEVIRDEGVTRRFYRSKVRDPMEYPPGAISRAAAMGDFQARAALLAELYEPVLPAPAARGRGLVKIRNANVVESRGVSGYLASRIVFFVMNLSQNKLQHPIYFVRHGESCYNLENRIGGNPLLTEQGMRDAAVLLEFLAGLRAHLRRPPPRLSSPHTRLRRGEGVELWTSQLQRAVQTGELAERLLRLPARRWSRLNEIHAGVCEGMTYAEVLAAYPLIDTFRRRSKYTFRYPDGESYQDLVARLEPVILELENTDRVVVVVAHQAVLRCLLAYFGSASAENSVCVPVPHRTVWRCTYDSKGIARLEELSLRDFDAGLPPGAHEFPPLDQDDDDDDDDTESESEEGD